MKRGNRLNQQLLNKAIDYFNCVTYLEDFTPE
jgi:hypothetical protein